MVPPVYRFGPFALNPAAYRLWKDDSEVELTPKAFALLQALVERAGALVTKEELFSRIWPDVAVTDNALTQVVSDLRQALGDAHDAPVYVQTVARRGYRFVGAVELGSETANGTESARSGQAPEAGRALVVLDFDNVTRDPNLHWLSSGIGETLTGALGAISGVRVQDRARVLALRGRYESPLDVARALGADLLVTGAYQQHDGRLRITGRLIDVTSGEIRGDARADGDLRGIFPLQDEIARQLSLAIGGTPSSRTGGRRARHTSNLDAYRAAVEGRLLLESLEANAVPDAIERFVTAIRLDPGYAAAHVGLANARGYLFERARHRPDPPVDVLQQAIDDARRGIALDEAYAEAHATLSFLLVSVADRDGAKQAARRALALEPGEWMHQFRLAHATWGAERLEALDRVLAIYPDFPFAYFQRAMVLVARALLDAAAAAIEAGLRIGGRDDRRRFPASGLHWMLGMIALSRGDVDGARRAFEEEAAAGSSTLYAEEFARGARIGLGFVALAAGRAADAMAHFEPLAETDGSGRALLGLALAARSAGAESVAGRALAILSSAARAGRARGRHDHAASLEAGLAAVERRDADAIGLLESWLGAAPPGPSGWTLPIDPVFAALRGTAGMDRVLAALAARAG